MSCCFRSTKPIKSISLKTDNNVMISEPILTVKHDVLLSFPHCRVHLVGSGEAVEIGNGDFSILNLLDDGIVIATVIKVGDDLQWPLTKDEPVVKLDSRDYLFSLPMKDCDPLSYGVSFLGGENSGGGKINLGQLDEFLRRNSCFSCSVSSVKGVIDWKDYAPKIEDYNNFLAKAIAHGTGQVVKGIFKCSNAYTSQVQRGGETILTQSNGGFGGSEKKKMNTGEGGGAVNRNLKRVRKLSKMTEKMSKVMLDGVGIVTGTAMAPVIMSGPGKRLLNMVPGQVLLASLDAVNRVLEAAEVAEKQALTATSGAATRMVSERFGENAGEATEDVLATAGHVANTAWNIFKIRKAIINPAAAGTVSSGGLLLKNAQPNFNIRNK